MGDEERKVQDGHAKPQTCEICGTGYRGEDEEKRHLQYKVHEVFVLIKDKIEELRKTKEERVLAARTEAEQERKKKNETIIKQQEGKRSRDRSRSRDDEGSKDDKTNVKGKRSARSRSKKRKRSASNGGSKERKKKASS